MPHLFRQSYYRNGVLLLASLAVLGWVFVAWTTVSTNSPLVKLMMPRDVAWSVTEIVFVWLMWALMMGAMIMGVQYGAYCVGCCWALMALLFIFGVMNLTAIVALATIVAVEKVFPFGDRLGQAGGVILIAWGVFLLAN